MILHKKLFKKQLKLFGAVFSSDMYFFDMYLKRNRKKMCSPIAAPEIWILLHQHCSRCINLSYKAAWSGLGHGIALNQLREIK